MAEDQQCAATRANTAPQALLAVRELDQHIETVPPEELSYLETEYVGASKTHNAARLNMLAKRRYFQAWMLHDALSALKDDLGLIDGPAYGNRERVQVQRAAFAMARVTMAVQAFTEYSVADERRAQPVLSNADTEKYLGQLTGLAPILSTYISCTVDAIK
ncbi:hypothetical protein [Burkholderia pseudomallei]|uniref:hypothetical protein n=1 Tax=Burkholderia pseudomallei TaxID=28450 RepID=UPI00193CE87F|nr:hypothetical protein [Burkholderia pseudomallei]QRM23542.1 hypothetical protein JQX71_04455 [Burkholderia pseudomallei]